MMWIKSMEKLMLDYLYESLAKCKMKPHHHSDSLSIARVQAFGRLNMQADEQRIRNPQNAELIHAHACIIIVTSSLHSLGSTFLPITTSFFRATITPFPIPPPPHLHLS